MPQVAPAAIRERAARLRALGARRVEAHLAAARGREVSLLMERPDLGRTEGFALARLRGAARAGQPGARPGHRARRRDARGGAGLTPRSPAPALPGQTTRKSVALRSRSLSSVANRSLADPPTPSPSKNRAPVSSL